MEEEGDVAVAEAAVKARVGEEMCLGRDPPVGGVGYNSISLDITVIAYN